MNPVVRNLFHELADLPDSDREKVFVLRQVSPDLRAEVESLLSFDAGDDQNNKQWGPYCPVRVLGSGGMGTVYLAERIDGEIQQKVAIKFLRSDIERPAWRDRFLKERQLLAYLNHPSIAHLIDAGHTADGRPYLAMEYVDGTPIDVYAAAMELREQLTLFLRVCEGVSHAHHRLIIHRDLKPSNILVDASGQPKLLDFGIAKLINESANRTLTVDRLLTPNYASPEQVLGAAESTATDVYSLGAVLYRILTGQSPHESAPGTSAVAQVVAGTRVILPPSRLKPMPSDMDYILGKALRHEPEERYGSVEAFANDIQAFLDWRPVHARSGDAWYRVRKFVRRSWLPVCATAVVIAGLSAGLFAVNRERAIAQQRFDQVRRLSNEVLALDDVIKGLPGSTKARNEIVAMSKNYLESLRAGARGDPDLQIELANAFATLARVQGVPIAPNLGQYVQAEESLIKADALAEAVLAAAPLNRKALSASAEINHDLMILDDSDHRRDAALAHARKAAMRLDGFLGTGNVTPQEAGNSARILSNVALAFKNQHLYNDSVRYGRRAVDLVRPIPGARPTLAGSLSVIADSLRYSGDLEGALATIREAKTAIETSDFPDETSRVSTYFNVLWRQGVILAGDGEINLDQPVEATAVLQQALDLIEDGAKKDPNDARTRILFASGGRELGNILRDRDPQRALKVFDHAIQRLGEIKNNAKAKRGEAQLLACSSYVLRRLNRAGEAQQRIDRAFTLLRETKDYPANIIEPGDEPGTVLRALADQYSDTGQTQRALETYRELFEKILASHPEPEKDLRQATALSSMYATLAILSLREGQSSQARTMSDLRLKLWQHWSRELPNSSFIRRELSEASTVIN